MGEGEKGVYLLCLLLEKLEETAQRGGGVLTADLQSSRTPPMWQAPRTPQVPVTFPMRVLGSSGSCLFEVGRRACCLRNCFV